MFYTINSFLLLGTKYFEYLPIVSSAFNTLFGGGCTQNRCSIVCEFSMSYARTSTGNVLEFSFEKMVLHFTIEHI